MDNGRIHTYLVSRWLQDLSSSYVSLHFSDPDVDDPVLSEVSGNGYKRQMTIMEPVSDRSIMSTKEIRFVKLPPTLLTHFALWDSEIGGQLLASGPLAAAVRLIGDSSYVIPANNIAISIA